MFNVPIFHLLFLMLFIFFQGLMTQLQTALENTDLPDLLMSTVDVILYLTETHPSAFSKHFRVRISRLFVHK